MFRFAMRRLNYQVADWRGQVRQRFAHGSQDDVAQNWASRLGQSGTRITQGVNAVKVAPGQAAAKQKAVWLANLQASSDRWASHVGAVSLSDWQNSMVNKGIPRIGTGATAAEPKFAQFMGRFLPFVDSAKASLPPRGDYNANKARMNAMIDKLHTFKK
jgi:hypothetical protein